jgi:proteasome lid subunit RPN8/RPN11
MSLEIQRAHTVEIRAHGEEAFPHECCGFLLGRLDASGVRITVATRRMTNETADTPERRFLITPRAYLRADREARQQGLDIIGFYHSHPDHPAEPSAFDLEHAWPNLSYNIVSVLAGRSAALRSWVLASDRGRFDEEAVTTPAGA